MKDWAQAIIDFDNCELEISTPAEDLSLDEMLKLKEKQLVEDSKNAKEECVKDHQAEASNNEKLEEENALER